MMNIHMNDGNMTGIYNIILINFCLWCIDDGISKSDINNNKVMSFKPKRAGEKKSNFPSSHTT